MRQLYCSKKKCRSALVLFAFFGITANLLFTLIGLNLEQYLYSNNPIMITHISNVATSPNSDILSDLQHLTSGDAELHCPQPLVKFENRVIRNNIIGTDQSKSLIPKILHVSMKSRCLPQDLIVYLNQWIHQLPNYSIFFHDDDAVEMLIQSNWTEFPNLHKAMHCVKYKGAMKIDIWRVLILYRFGGIYSDIDNWATEGFNEDVIPANVTGFFFSDVWSRPSQWFMAFKPRHPMMHSAMNIIIRNTLNIENIMKPKLIWTTGPEATNEAYSIFTAGSKNRSKPGFHTGSHNNTILKYQHDGWGPNNLVLNQGFHNFNDLVIYKNQTITRRERIERETGVLHFTKQRRNNIETSVSCKQHLANMVTS